MRSALGSPVRVGRPKRARIPAESRRPRNRLCPLVAVVVIATGCSVGGKAAGPSGAVNGAVIPSSKRHTVPQLAGRTLTGGSLNVSDWRGSVVVVNFWGSWCAPCKKEQPDLERLARESKGQGVHFVGIDVRDRNAAALAHVRRFNVTYPSLVDTNGQQTLAFGAMAPRATPSTFVLDRRGRVASRFFGATNFYELRATVVLIVAEGGQDTG